MYQHHSAAVLDKCGSACESIHPFIRSSINPFELYALSSLHLAVVEPVLFCGGPFLLASGQSMGGEKSPNVAPPHRPPTPGTPRSPLAPPPPLPPHPHLNS